MLRLLPALLAAPLLAVFAPAARAGWVSDTHVDGFTDETMHYVRLDSGAPSAVGAQIGLWCDEDAGAVVFNMAWSVPAGAPTEGEAMPFHYRFDDGPREEGMLRVAAHDPATNSVVADTIVRGSEEVTLFFGQMLSRSSLRAWMGGAVAESEAARFDLAGLGEMLGPFESHCGLFFDQSGAPAFAPSAVEWRHGSIMVEGGAPGHFFAGAAPAWSHWSNPAPHLSFNCLEGWEPPAPAITLHWFRPMSADGGGRMLEYRFDGGEVESVFLATDEDGVMSFAAPATPRQEDDFFRDMLSSDSLRVRAGTFSMGTHTARFDLAGVRSGIERIEESCGADFGL